MSDCFRVSLGCRILAGDANEVVNYSFLALKRINSARAVLGSGGGRVRSNPTGLSLGHRRSKSDHIFRTNQVTQSLTMGRSGCPQSLCPQFSVVQWKIVLILTITKFLLSWHLCILLYNVYNMICLSICSPIRNMSFTILKVIALNTLGTWVREVRTRVSGL